MAQKATLLKTENYKGFQIHINEVVDNPNGQKSQTALIYKNGDFVGGSFADVQFEDATQKAKNKINSYL